MDVKDKYSNLNLDTFTALIKTFFPKELDARTEGEKILSNESSFAKRLMTGTAAENYFENEQPRIPEFKDFDMQKVTGLGCGFDYQLSSCESEKFLAIEVKGLQERSGSIMLTEKEHKVAEVLKERFFLFIVYNFREKPFHRIFNKPLLGPLKFSRKERIITEISWSASC